MRFARFALDEAEGAVLAHSIGTPERTLKKGSLLSADDVAVLRAAGFEPPKFTRQSKPPT